MPVGSCTSSYISRLVLWSCAACHQPRAEAMLLYTMEHISGRNFCVPAVPGEHFSLRGSCHCFVSRRESRLVCSQQCLSSRRSQHLCHCQSRGQLMSRRRSIQKKHPHPHIGWATGRAQTERTAERFAKQIKRFRNQGFQSLEADLKTAFLKIKGHIVQVYHMSSGNSCFLRWQKTIYKLMVPIWRQPLKAWLRFPIYF